MAESKEKAFGIYSKVQAPRLKDYDKKNKTKYDLSKGEVIESGSLLSHSYVEEYNKDSKKTGVYYKLDEKATEAHLKSLKEKIKKLD